MYAIYRPGTEPHLLRAWNYRQLNQFDLALADVDEAQKIAWKANQPKVVSGVLYQRSVLHAQQKHYPDAVSDLQASLKLNDKNPFTLNAFAWLRATVPDAAFRNGPESVSLARKAVALTHEDSYAALDTLAAAYAESNDYSRAIECERHAIAVGKTELTDASKAREFQRQATARLRLFEQHQPYHAELYQPERR